MEIPANNESEAAAGVKCFRQLFAGTPKLLGACTLPPSRRLLSKNSLPFPGQFNLKPTLEDLCATLDFHHPKCLGGSPSRFHPSTISFYSKTKKESCDAEHSR